MNNISITVPMDYFALTRASDMLNGIALDMRKDGQVIANGVQVGKSETTARALIQRIDESNKSVSADLRKARDQDADQELAAEIAEDAALDDQRDATEVFGGGVKDDTEEVQKTLDPKSEDPAAVTSTTEPLSAPEGVDVDKDCLPWDERIDSSGKTKLAKTGNWKKKRKPKEHTKEDWEAYVKGVQDELRAAMAAGPDNPITTPATTTPAAPPAESPAPPPGAVETTTIKTFPELMAAITANGKTQAEVTAAVNTQGLEALPLLAARPDLIPAVALELFK